MARRRPEILRFLGVWWRCCNQGPALQRMHEEIGSSVGAQDSSNAGRFQREGGELAKRAPLGLSTRRARARGRPIRASPGTGSRTSTTGTVFSTRINSRGSTDRRTFCLDTSTGGDTASIRASDNAGHPRPNSLGAHSGLNEYR